jgi:hypothetical protein
LLHKRVTTIPEFDALSGEHALHAAFREKMHGEGAVPCASEGEIEIAKQNLPKSANMRVCQNGDRRASMRRKLWREHARDDLIVQRSL